MIRRPPRSTQSRSSAASDVYKRQNVYGFGHNPYYRNVVDVLLQRAEPLTDGRDGRKSVEIVQAIYLSAKTGKRISLPL